MEHSDKKSNEVVAVSTREQRLLLEIAQLRQAPQSTKDEKKGVGFVKATAAGGGQVEYTQALKRQLEATTLETEALR